MMARQRIRGSRTRDQDATVWRKGRLDDAEGQSQKEQAGFDSSIRIVRRCRAKKKKKSSWF